MAELSQTQQMAPALLLIITDFDRTKKVKEILSDSLLRFMFTVAASGTAKSEILDLLGLGSVEKALIVCLLPKFRASEIMQKVAYGLDVARPGNGIAFTVPLSGISAPVSKMFSEENMKRLIDTFAPEKKERAMQLFKNISENAEFLKRIEELERMKREMEKEMGTSGDCEHDLILSVINLGYSDELIDAAREAGATGGTIVHARRTGPDEAVKFFGISLQAEKEIVAILAERGKRNAIMKAISQACGLTSEAAGIVFSVPVDGIAGLNS